jgi:hypothetical protein
LRHIPIAYAAAPEAHTLLGWLIFLGVIGSLIGAGVLVAWLLRRARRRSMARLAERLGYRLLADQATDLPGRYGFFKMLSGADCGAKARNVIQGEHRGASVHILDYIARGCLARGGVLTIEMPGWDLPQFILQPDRLGDRHPGALDYVNIDIKENEEFSKRFRVSCYDGEFARKALNARQMEMLLSLDDITIEMGWTAMAFHGGDSPLEVEQVHRTAWRFIRNIPGLMPEPEAGEGHGPPDSRGRPAPSGPAPGIGSTAHAVIGIMAMLSLWGSIALGVFLMGTNPWLGIGVAGVLSLASAFVLFWAERLKRQRPMARLARRLGYSYSPRPEENLLDRYDFLQLFRTEKFKEQGNLIQGERGSFRVRIFDYGGPGGTVVVFEAPGKDFPPFCLRRELPTDRAAAAAGFEDIDFESDEFSRKYYVTCKDRRFAFDVINARQMEMLLTLDDINIEIGRFVMAFYLSRSVSPTEIDWLHDLAWRFIGNVPEYVFAKGQWERLPVEAASSGQTPGR